LSQALIKHVYARLIILIINIASIQGSIVSTPLAVISLVQPIACFYPRRASNS